MHLDNYIGLLDRGPTIPHKALDSQSYMAGWQNGYLEGRTHWARLAERELRTLPDLRFEKCGDAGNPPPQRVDVDWASCLLNYKVAVGYSGGRRLFKMHPNECPDIAI
jgi:hypothetical protein